MAVTPPCWQRGSAATNSEGWDVCSATACWLFRHARAMGGTCIQECEPRHQLGGSPCLALPGSHHDLKIDIKVPLCSLWEREAQGRMGHNSTLSLLWNKAILCSASVLCVPRSGTSDSLSFGAKAAMFMVPVSCFRYLRFPTLFPEVRYTDFAPRQ